MLVLSRERDETVIITVPPSAEPQRIVMVYVEQRGHKVRLGFDAHPSVVIHRGEIQEQVDREQRREDGRR